MKKPAKAVLLAMVVACAAIAVVVCFPRLLYGRGPGKTFFVDVDDPGCLAVFDHPEGRVIGAILDVVHFARAKLGFPSEDRLFPIETFDEIHFEFSEKTLFRTLFERMEDVSTLGGLHYVLQKDRDSSVRMFFGPYEGYWLPSRERIIVLCIEVDERGFRERIRRVAYGRGDADAVLAKKDETPSVVELYCTPRAACSTVFEAACTNAAFAVNRPVLVISGTYDEWSRNSDR